MKADLRSYEASCKDGSNPVEGLIFFQGSQCSCSSYFVTAKFNFTDRFRLLVAQNFSPEAHFKQRDRSAISLVKTKTEVFSDVFNSFSRNHCRTTIVGYAFQTSQLMKSFRANIRPKNRFKRKTPYNHLTNPKRTTKNDNIKF